MAIQYVARKRMKVEGRTVEPGEIVPEATGWKNIHAYVDGGSLAVALEVPAEAVENTELKGRVAALEARVAALEARLDEADSEEAGAEPVDLSDWKRDALDALAVRAGVTDPARLPNKDAVIAAIHEAVDPEALASLIATGEEA